MSFKFKVLDFMICTIFCNIAHSEITPGITKTNYPPLRNDKAKPSYGIGIFIRDKMKFPNAQHTNKYKP